MPALAPRNGTSPTLGPTPRPTAHERKAIVDRLCDEAARRGIRIQRDKTSLGPGDSIPPFMQCIGSGDRLFVVLRERYP